jgi:hypothetical protein
MADKVVQISRSYAVPGSTLTLDGIDYTVDNELKITVPDTFSDGDLLAALGGAVGGATAASASAPIDAVLATGGSVGQSGTPADGNTVTINGRVYTFKTALTPTNDEVLINGGDGSLTNLQHAINGTGGTADTDYKVATANADVSAGNVGSSAIALTVRTKGEVGNITLSKVGANLSVVSPTGGVDGTPGFAGEELFAAGNKYLCTVVATTATSGAWKKVTIGSL